MSLMPRPRPSPLPAHDRHDRLLVAQLVAGDPLDAAREAEVRALVGTCRDCAQLAADLRLLPAIVAQEPVPPRRRDFRLSPEQAEHLSGNPITRFLRRLSWPRARAFAPAAGAVMSIGLVFVVAGYAWPDGGTLLDTGAVEESAPMSADAPAASGIAADVADGAGGPVPAAPDDALPRTRALRGPDGATPDPAFFDSLPESQAGTSEALRMQSFAAEASPAWAADVGDTAASDPNALAMGVSESAESTEPAAPAGKVADDLAAADEAVAAEDLAAANGSVAQGGLDAERTSAPGSDTSEVLGRLLVVTGAALAIAGGLLLVLGWLVRRVSDPLLR